MVARFNPPPTWPVPPPGWTPEPGWRPDPSWGPPPPGWQVWLEEGRPQHANPGRAGVPVLAKVAAVVVVGLFGASAIGVVLGEGGGPSSGDGTAPAEPSAASNGGGGAATAPERPTTQTEPTAPATPGVGDRVRDGVFEFTVLKVRTGIRRIGDAYARQKAQGEFVLITVRVTNIGDEAQTLFDAAQKAYDAKGREFAADSEAASSLEGNDVLWEQVNPGNKVTGRIVFDVPRGTELVALEVHDSIWSGGSAVALIDR